ncbi:MAG TPA: ComEC/Rec2 family competence protein [Ferruginibacter sp.]|nr:ComEC/Rec2 family competence protein [Ferruginibacter sp.]
MRNPYRIPPWKTAPFFRLLLPLITGILLQWHIHFNLSYIVICITCFSVTAFIIYFLPVGARYKVRHVTGIFIHCIIASFAMLITWFNDPRHQSAWYGRYDNTRFFIIRVNEPLLTKTNSYKTSGIIEGVIVNEKIIPTNGKLLVYFSKDSVPPAIKYGDYILAGKKPQHIKNSGNPGAFDYKRYASFHQVYHQVFLKKSDWKILPVKSPPTLQGALFAARESLLKILRKFITGKEELSIAEALLIGYDEDLDKDLIQAYSNTGVVHIIAISGLHLGLIFFVLSWILNRIPYVKHSAIIKAVLLIASLWLFSLLTGGCASVLRSAVMFTTIVIGKSYFKNMPVSNCLCSSAFILLCFNPYFLWDVGFQLSYLAIAGIIFVQQPVYRLLFIKNKWLDKVWQMASVTIAAQLLTFPVCLYYFHQFPLTFLFSNLVSVPLSTIILFSEIFLLAFSAIPFAGIYAGKAIAWMIGLMNSIIRFFNGLPYSLIDNIYADIFTTWLLYGLILFLGGWLFYKNKLYLKLSLMALLTFTAVYVHSKIKIIHQQKIIVYNIPHYSAIDFIYRTGYHFYGDSILDKKGMLRNFHLRPARIAFQLESQKSSIKDLCNKGVLWQFFGTKIMIVDSAYKFNPRIQTIPVDMLIISKSPKIKIGSLLETIAPSVVVLDASNSLWKIAQWKKECEQLHLPCHSVPEKGAFILNVE